MENNEMLQAMQQMINQLETKLTATMDEKLTPIKEDIRKLGDRIDSVETNLSNRMDKIDNRMDKMEGRLDRVETLLEHEIPRQLKLLAEGHSMVLKHLPDADSVEDLTDRITTLERIAKDHTRDIEELEQA